MSKVAIKGANTGTGTFTIESPATNTDRTLSLPDASGTILTTATAGVPVNGPAFSALQSTGQSFSGSTFTKLSFTSEQYDTNASYDNSTSRFTPSVAGYYVVNIALSMSTVVSQCNVVVYKNGSVHRGGFSTYPTPTSGGAFVSAMVYLNGSTDYIEAYVYAIGTSPGTASGAYTFFEAAMIRSAT